MKKRFLSFVLAVVFLFSAFPIVASATTASTEEVNASLTITSFSLSLENAVYMNFKVASENIEDTSKIQLLVWENAPELYKKGTESVCVAISTLDSNGRRSFQYTNLAAKDMTKTIYVCAYANIDGVEVYSSPTKFSIAMYAYLKRNASNPDTDLVKLLDAMLAYGALAQTYFDHNTNFLATDTVCQITVNNGTLDDGFSKGWYKEGTTIRLMADEVPSGYYFSHWENDNGEVVSERMECDITLSANAENYTAVYGSIEEYYQNGLEYRLNDDGTCSVVGIGSCANNTTIIIPETFNDSAITNIAENAFANCSNLEVIVIPTTITSIDANAFNGCSLYQNIYKGTSTEWNQITVAEEGNDSITKQEIICNNTNNDDSNNEDEEIVYNMPILSEDYAAAFFCFLTNNPNLDKETVTNHDWYKIMIGTYDGEDLYRKAHQLYSFIYQQLGAAKIDTRQVVSTLENQYAIYEQKVIDLIDPTEMPFLAALKNEFQDYTAEYASNFSMLMIGLDIAFPVTLIYTGLEAIKTGAEYGKLLGNSLVALESNVLLDLKEQQLAMYSYFMKYLQYRSGYQSANDWSFQNELERWRTQLNTDYDNVPFYATLNWISDRKNFTESIPVLDKWGEFVYQLKLCIEYNGFDRNKPSEGLTYTSSSYGYIVSGIGTCKDTDLIIPSIYNERTVVGIAANAFKDCTFIKSVFVPDTVTEIGKGAFFGCSSIERMTLPFSGGYAIPKGNYNEDSLAFGYIFGQTAYDGGEMISQTIGAIWSEQFCIPISLKTITITGDEIAYATFSNLKVENINLTGNPDSIPTDAFANVDNITEIRIPSGVIEIGFTYNGMNYGYTFSGCENLKDIYIPVTLESINKYVFSGCDNLTNIYYEGSREDFSKLTIYADGNSVLYNVAVHYNAYTPEQ